MSRQRRNQRLDKGDSKASHALYVYCVGERSALAQLFEEPLPDAIEPNARLELVVERDLAAVVSPVSLDDYGEESLKERLNDAAWTAVRAVRHEQVVEHFSARASVVPLRFGAIYFVRGGVEQMLAEKRAEIEEVIARIGGRQEWGITVCCDREEFIKIVETVSPRLGEMAERAKGARPGEAYLLRKKIEAMKADEARLEIRRIVAEIKSALAAHSEEAVGLRVLKDEATEQGAVVAKLAFLVDRKHFDAFREETERLARTYAETGFRFEMTGPWPAYNFSTGENR